MDLSKSLAKEIIARKHMTKVLGEEVSNNSKLLSHHDKEGVLIFTNEVTEKYYYFMIDDNGKIIVFKNFIMI